MKLIIALSLIALSTQSFAGDCVKKVQTSVLKEIAKVYKVPAASLKIRYIGGESRDGDIDENGNYVSPSEEYFDVFAKNVTPTTTNALGLFVVAIEEVTHAKTGKTISCQAGDYGAIPKKDWKTIYNTYL